LLRGTGGITMVLFPVGHTSVDAGLSTNGGAGAQMSMVGDAHLSTAADVVPGCDRAGEPDLRRECIVFSDPAVVGDHDLIVELCSRTDDGGSDHRPVNRRARA